mgnify:CR=1 FL=1
MAETFLEMGQAIELFYRLADRDSMHHHNTNICLARSLNIAEAIEGESGVRAGKLCAFAPEGDMLKVKDNPAVSPMGWYFHVAATLPIMWENGEIKDLVFDPTLFDAPVDANQWRKKIKADFNGLAGGSLDQSLSVDHPEYRQLTVHFKEKGARQKMYEDGFQPLRRKRRRVFASALADTYFQKPREITRKRFGSSWELVRRS